MKKSKIPTPDLCTLLGDLQKIIGQKQMAQLERELANLKAKPSIVKSKDSSAIFQLKITLKRSQPPIWRRLLVPGKTKLNWLHEIFQDAMGWGHCHLHQFKVGDCFYSMPDPEFEAFDERKFRLQDLAALPRKRFSYEYDFGDGWDHQVVVEKIVEKDPRYSGHPVCLAGAGHCPPEDCGGMGGFYELLEIIQDPKHPQHKEMTDWLGSGFDPEAFDLVRTNSRLSRLGIS
jgi:hypothetical protein